MEEIMNLISSQGFPIAMCLILLYYVSNLQKTHKEEMDKMSTAINNNTAVIQRLLDKMEGD